MKRLYKDSLYSSLYSLPNLESELAILLVYLVKSNFQKHFFLSIPHIQIPVRRCATLLENDVWICILWLWSQKTFQHVLVYTVAPLILFSVKIRGSKIWLIMIPHQTFNVGKFCSSSISLWRYSLSMISLITYANLFKHMASCCTTKENAL